MRTATADQLALVITREGAGTGYVRRGLRALGLVDYGGRERVAVLLAVLGSAEATWRSSPKEWLRSG